MSEVILAVLLISVIAGHLVAERAWVAERRRLLNAALADTPEQFVALERVTTRAPRPVDAEPTPRPIGL